MFTPVCSWLTLASSTWVKPSQRKAGSRLIAQQLIQRHRANLRHW